MCWRGCGDDPVAGRSTDSVGGAVANADAHADESNAAPLNAWIAFLKHWKEAQEISDLSYSPVQQAMKKLQDLSGNEEDRYRALAREGREGGRKATRARLVTRRSVFCRTGLTPACSKPPPPLLLFVAHSPTKKPGTCCACPTVDKKQTLYGSRSHQ
jgi:hypothetical protein